MISYLVKQMQSSKQIAHNDAFDLESTNTNEHNSNAKHLTVITTNTQNGSVGNPALYDALASTDVIELDPANDASPNTLA
jgi:hypothetical protein